ncbi:hypothetical protein FCM35_KLT18912 [Carex littledalei]|uniref:Uncharacterized protein n=1 Tax=Carex littledalei TaxID=544730 RepID=A0A833VEZ4_9POAL|nr:hypothetical protein FCM35_KLT18912 [Carex littledalei]
MDIFMIRTLIRALRHANLAVIRANQAADQNQRNMELGNLGSNLIIMGAINFAAMILALVLLSEKIFAYPILSVFIVVSGLTGIAGITVGMFLLAVNNPGHYRHLAMVILWASCLAAPFTIGILLVASLSPSCTCTSL